MANTDCKEGCIKNAAYQIPGSSGTLATGSRQIALEAMPQCQCLHPSRSHPPVSALDVDGDQDGSGGGKVEGSLAISLLLFSAALEGFPG